MMIRVANEHERFAEVVYGRYRGLKGPGVVIKIPGSEWRLLRLRVGDRGELVSPELGRFYGTDLLVAVEQKTPLGTIIRIIGFEGAGLEACIRVIPENKCSPIKGHPVKKKYLRTFPKIFRRVEQQKAITVDSQLLFSLDWALFLFWRQKGSDKSHHQWHIGENPVSQRTSSPSRISSSAGC